MDFISDKLQHLLWFTNSDASSGNNQRQADTGEGEAMAKTDSKREREIRQS